MAKPKKIKLNVCDAIQRSLGDALACEPGLAIDLRVTEIRAPPKALKPEEIWRPREPECLPGGVRQLPLR